MAQRHPALSGGKWIRPDRRLAIYIRDGLACVWCLTGIEDGARLTLDHIVPWSVGGSNDTENLVTACHECNSLRGAMCAVLFADTIAEETGEQLRAILRRVKVALGRSIDRAAAKRIIEARKSFATCQTNS